MKPHLHLVGLMSPAVQESDSGTLVDKESDSLVFAFDFVVILRKRLDYADIQPAAVTALQRQENSQNSRQLSGSLGCLEAGELIILQVGPTSNSLKWAHECCLFLVAVRQLRT